MYVHVERMEGILTGQYQEGEVEGVEKNKKKRETYI
jgi:hypothetical protein